MSLTTGSNSKNDDQLFDHLNKNGKKNRSQLVKEMKLPRSSVFDSLNRLILAGVVIFEQAEYNLPKKGRPEVYFKVKSSDF